MRKVLILEAIRLGYFEEALKVLLKATKATSEYSNAILLSSRFNGYKKTKNEGSESSEDIRRLKITLNKSFIGIIEMEGFSHLEVEIPQDALTPQDPLTQNIKILFLGIQPKGTRVLRIDQESRDTQERIKMSKHRDNFSFKDVRAVRATDLLSNLVNEKPDIVHFSGHGYEEEGLVFEDNDGKPHVIKPEVIAELFEMITSTSPIKCVILNACYSEPIAEKIAKHVDYVIGMKDAFPDVSAVDFSVGFYDTLGANEGFNVDMAYKSGRLNIMLNNNPGADLLVLHKKG